MTLTTAPLEVSRWPDLEALFGPNGAVAGCWCMWWRLPAKDWGPIDANRDAFQEVVTSGEPTGVLAYDGDTPVGWCAIGPREAYARILRSQKLKPTDPDEPGVWSLNCFYIKRAHRRQGVAGELIEAAVRYAAGSGARVVEAYPVDTRGAREPSGDLFTGTVDMFAQARFREHVARGGRRVVMRRDLE